MDMNWTHLLAIGIPSFAGVTGLLLVIAGFGFLIFVHELGHFLVARWVGIKVTQFSIGIGPSIVAWRKGLGYRIGSTEPEYERRIKARLIEAHEDADDESRKADGEFEIPSSRISEIGNELGMSETEYRLNWLPLGGYVKMEGQEDMDPTARSDDARAFNNRPVWARAAVISAGVVMNLIFAVIFFVIAFMAGVNFPAPEVGQVKPNGPAAKAYPIGHEKDSTFQGLQPGDVIRSIDGEPVHDFADVSVSAGLARADEPLKIEVERDGQSLTYLVTPETGPEGLMWLGITSASLPILADTGDRLPLPDDLREAGVRPGMAIASVNGKGIRRLAEVFDAISESGGAPTTVTFADPSHERPDVTVTLKPKAILNAWGEDRRGLLGLIPPTRISQVIPRSPAAKAGLRKGDVIARLGPLVWPDPKTVSTQVPKLKGTKLEIEVLRDGEVKKLEPVAPDRSGKLGIALTDAEQAFVSHTVEGSPAATINPPAGSRITAINGQPVRTWSDAQRILQELVEKTHVENASDSGETTTVVSMTFELNVSEHPTETAEIHLAGSQLERLSKAGWAMAEALAFVQKEVTLRTEDPLEAIDLGIHRTHIVMLQTYQTLARLFQGTVPAKALRGPVGIADIGTQIVQTKGWTFLMFFLGLISVNLAVLNFLPLPIVDGGLMVFLLIEKIKGSPVSPVVLTANVIGLALLGSLFLFVTFHDISRLFTGG